jgi:hypothetical protein
MTLKQIFFIGLLTFFFGCKDDIKRPFFTNMKPSYPDLKANSSFYFTKDFGIQSDPVFIGAIPYWRITCSEESYFFMAGFVRELDDSIILIPDVIGPSYKFRHDKLFDFNTNLGSSWNLYLNDERNMIACDSIVYAGLEKDSIYIYDIYPYYIFKKNNSRSYRGYEFKTSVTKKSGILNVTTFNSSTHDTLFLTSFYPETTITQTNQGSIFAL